MQISNFECDGYLVYTRSRAPVDVTLFLRTFGEQTPSQAAVEQRLAVLWRRYGQPQPATLTATGREIQAILQRLFEEEDACAADERNERAYALREHRDNGRIPLPRDSLVPRFWRGTDWQGGVDPVGVIIDTVTGARVLSKDLGDPADTDPYYGAVPDGTALAGKGYDIQELVDPARQAVTPAECARQMGVEAALYEYPEED